jgi:putative copper export protein
MRAILAWPVLAAQLLIFGTAVFALSLADDASGERERLLASLIGAWRVLGLTALLFSPILFVEIAAGMAGTDCWGALPFATQVLRETHAGAVWEWRLPLTISLGVVAWLPLARARMALLLLLLSGALMLCESLTSHAIDHGDAAVAIHWVHQMSVAVWIGAILSFWLGAQRARLSDVWVNATAPWVSRLAEWTVAALILSGVYTAYHALKGDPALLLYAAYGRVLLVKLGAASIVLMIGAYNRFMLIPELAVSGARGMLLRNVAIESILLLGVVGVAALLANTPPAH